MDKDQITEQLATGKMNRRQFNKALTALGAFLGHLFPLYFRFEGGRGVATALGVLVAIDWQLAPFLIATWLVVAAVFRFSSLAALATAAAAPVVVGIMDCVADRARRRS